MPAWEPRFRNRWPLIPYATRLATLAINMARSVPMPPADAVMPELSRIAVFGGIYSNYLSLAIALRDARARGAEACYCLGDLGALGPHPDRVFPLAHEHAGSCI